MTLPTHIIFYVLISNLFGIPLKVVNLIAGISGTILPDISNPYGGIGKIIRPVSNYISQKWGHRSITHSWVILLLAFAACIPVRWITDNNAVWLFLLGIMSHIGLDMFNISGVRFFYPDTMLGVIPAEHEIRIGTGSKREKRLAFALFFLAVITIPLGLWGHESTLRFIAGSHTAAVEEYKSVIDTNEVFVEVRTGINRITQEPIVNKTFKVVAAMPKKLTLVETESGKRITIGQVEDAIIETKKMRVKKGVLIKTEIIEIDAEKEGWNRIQKELESPYSYAIGTIMLGDKPMDYRPEVDRWEGITIQGNIITLNYSGIEAVNKVSKYKIIEGKIKIRKELSEEGIMAPLKEAETINKTETFLINASYEGLKVREGQNIRKGEGISIDPEAEKTRAEIEALRKSLNTKDIEEEKASALQDRSLEIKRQIDAVDKNIEVQKRIVEKAGNAFKEAEKARCDKLQRDRENLEKEYNEIQRSIKENREYIIKRKNALKEETESQIKALYAQINAMTKRSPYDGKVKAIRQKSANVFEVEVETN